MKYEYKDKEDLMKYVKPFFNVHLAVNDQVNEIISFLGITWKDRKVQYEDNFYNLFEIDGDIIEKSGWDEFIDILISRFIDYNDFNVSIRELLRDLKDSKFRSAFMDNIFYDTGDLILCLQIYFSNIIIDGEPSLLIVVLHDEGVIKDKLELIETSNQKDLLLKEVHHRFKNNLQILNSLINLQQRFGYDDSEVIESMKLFISSMSIVHEKLYSGDVFGCVNLSSFFKQFKSLFLDLYSPWKIDFKYDIDEDLNLDIQSIMPFSLVLNELIINTIKYAFPDDFEGKKEIYCSLKGENDVLLFSYKDNGIGLQGKSSKDSLGKILINSLIRQVDGDFEIIDSDKGFDCEIRFPYDDIWFVGGVIITTILVIEDEAIISLDLCFELKDKGFTVYHSDDYYDALKIIYDKKPDLIITDLKLKSGFVGIDIYNKFKDDGYKFIIISGTNHDKKLDDFIKSENLIFVNKPFVFEDLFDKINELLNK